MSIGTFYFFSIGVLSLIFLPGLLRAQTPTPTPENTTTDSEIVSNEKNNSEPAPKRPEDLIHFGDLIDVDVIGSTEYDWRGKLSPEGFLGGISFVVEPIYGLCKSEDEVALAVSKNLEKFLNNPQVAVRILDRSGRPVTQVFGAVRTLQRFQIRRPFTLNELIVLSGGITEKASGEIQILRPPNLSCQQVENPKQAEPTTGEEQAKEKFIQAKQEIDSQYIKVKISDLLKGKPEANPLILPGDVVTVTEAKPIYVIGGVINPRQINSNTQLTLSRAIDSAGGFAKDAETRKIIIFRRGKNETKTIEVDYEKIKSSAENDIVLQALDIIEVPQRGREKSRFPPVIKSGESETGNNLLPPLKIID